MTKQNPNQYPIWYSKELIRIIIEKDYYFTLKKITKNPNIIALFKNKRSEYKRLKKKCLHDYEFNIESKLKYNTKCFFAYTKSMQKSNFLPQVMNYKNQSSENLKDTADLFAQYFSSVYANSINTAIFNVKIIALTIFHYLSMT